MILNLTEEMEGLERFRGRGRELQACPDTAQLSLQSQLAVPFSQGLVSSASPMPHQANFSLHAFAL